MTAQKINLESQLYNNKISLEKLIIDNLNKEIEQYEFANLNKRKQIEEDYEVLFESKKISNTDHPQEIKKNKIKQIIVLIKDYKSLLKLNIKKINDIEKIQKKLKFEKDENIILSFTKNAIAHNQYDFYKYILQKRNADIKKHIADYEQEITRFKNEDTEVFTNSLNALNEMLNRRIAINKESIENNIKKIIALRESQGEFEMTLKKNKKRK